MTVPNGPPQPVNKTLDRSPAGGSGEIASVSRGRFAGAASRVAGAGPAWVARVDDGADVAPAGVVAVGVDVAPAGVVAPGWVGVALPGVEVVSLPDDVALPTCPGVVALDREPAAIVGGGAMSSRAALERGAATTSATHHPRANSRAALP